MSNLVRDDPESVQDEEERELLCLKIKAQLEEFFSDSHLEKDGFLLKTLQRNRQGYVSLKLLTSFKEIKALTTNWYMTLAAVMYSELLEVNDDRTKVRRKEPLPKWLLCSLTSNHLLAWNICEEQSREAGAARGLEHPSLSERIRQKFSVHGSVTSVWILHPGKELPKVLQCYAKRHNQLGQHLCAVVQFDCLEATRKAFNALKAEERKSNGKGMRVVPLGYQAKHHLIKDEPSKDDSDQLGEDTPSAEDPLEVFVQQEPSSPVKVSDETPDTCQAQTSSDNSIQGNSEKIFTRCNDQSFSGLHQRRRYSGDSVQESYGSPWVLRRKSAATALNPKRDTYLNAPHLRQRVLRQPFGPDGTKGFHGRGKPLQ